MGGVRKGREERDGDMKREREEKRRGSGCNRRRRRGKKETRYERRKGGW